MKVAAFLLLFLFTFQVLHAQDRAERKDKRLYKKLARKYKEEWDGSGHPWSVNSQPDTITRYVFYHDSTKTITVKNLHGAKPIDVNAFKHKYGTVSWVTFFDKTNPSGLVTRTIKSLERKAGVKVTDTLETKLFNLKYITLVYENKKSKGYILYRNILGDNELYIISSHSYKKRKALLAYIESNFK